MPKPSRRNSTGGTTLPPLVPHSTSFNTNTPPTSKTIKAMSLNPSSNLPMSEAVDLYATHIAEQFASSYVSTFSGWATAPSRPTASGQIAGDLNRTGGVAHAADVIDSGRAVYLEIMNREGDDVARKQKMLSLASAMDKALPRKIRNELYEFVDEQQHHALDHAHGGEPFSSLASQDTAASTPTPTPTPTLGSAARGAAAAAAAGAVAGAATGAAAARGGSGDGGPVGNNGGGGEGVQPPTPTSTTVGATLDNYSLQVSYTVAAIPSRGQVASGGDVVIVEADYCGDDDDNVEVDLAALSSTSATSAKRTTPPLSSTSPPPPPPTTTTTAPPSSTSTTAASPTAATAAATPTPPPPSSTATPATTPTSTSQAASNARTNKKRLQVFTVGRAAWNDFCLPDNNVSRLHMVAFCYPGGVVLVDGWSFHGTSIVGRASSHLGLECSVPTHRAPLFIPANESVTVSLGPYATFTINPKRCVVCMDNARDVRFSCKHCVACNECAAKLQECPVCRKVISTASSVTGRAAAPNRGTFKGRTRGSGGVGGGGFANLGLPRLDAINPISTNGGDGDVLHGEPDIEDENDVEEDAIDLSKARAEAVGQINT